MTIYIPLIYFEVVEEDREIADVIFHGFYKKEDAMMIHPEASIIEVKTDGFNPKDN